MLFSDFFNEIGGDSLKLLVNTIYSIMLSNFLLGVGLNYCRYENDFCAYRGASGFIANFELVSA